MPSFFAKARLTGMFAAELRVWPGWITEAERGAGFAELAQALLAARPTSGAGCTLAPPSFHEPDAGTA